MGKKKEASPAPAAPEVQRTAVVDPQAQEQYKKPVGVQAGRSCRDVFFMILFLLFWVGMVVIAVLAFRNGDFNRLTHGVDSWGNLCGSMNPAVNGIAAFDATNKPYLHYMNPLVDPVVKVCVEKCPVSQQIVCVYGATPSTNLVTLNQQRANGTCFPALADTQNVFYRCVPVNAINLAAEQALNSNSTASRIANVVATDMNASEMATKISQTLADSWPVILGMSGVALVISFVWLLLLNFFAGPLVWLTVILANISMGAITAFVWSNWNAVRTGGQVRLTGNSTLDTQMYNQTTLLIIGVITGVVFAVIFLISIAARRRIKLAIVIIRETSKAVRVMPMIFLFPVFKYVFTTGLFAFFVAVFALLSTSGQAISGAATNTAVTQLQNQGQGNLVRYVTPDRVLYFMQIYFVFGFLWTWQFILGVWQTTIAGAVATWYWSRVKTNLPRFPVAGAFWRCFRYHLGSIALGSMLIAIVQLIRLLLAEAQRKLKGSGNKTAQYILSCLQCCFWCLEKFMKFINKNAYIEVAVYGYSFCEAARTAFQLLFRNAFRVVVVDKVSNFLLFLGKVFITAVTCVIALAVLNQRYSNLSEFFAVPLIFIFVISWIIASTFASVVDMGIDTLFLCFCEDTERHDGSANNPYYMSKELKEFTDKNKGKVPDIAS
ncbi:plasma-membrane choline transporter-domain-containing protein [Catenaria anguillulae PL171]|uniref:Protein PNS1 n=1 Tax=Catenaria anguillulae PL171 TaxID=765915 RepID=A0A1Y2HEU9_9FUNG|nr:plasma-membrane choline transporter-domain-containing protein [Catenaria anguillulae PL171]